MGNMSFDVSGLWARSAAGCAACRPLSQLVSHLPSSGEERLQQQGVHFLCKTQCEPEMAGNSVLCVLDRGKRSINDQQLCGFV